MSNAILPSSLDKTFIEFHPETWAQVLNFQTQLSGWIFRGQSCNAWKLETSLERSYRRISPSITISECEKNTIKRFKRGAHLVAARTPDPKNTLEWLALIQHHGGPTRLLDFTRSFHIATFFALENAESDAAVWCLNAHRLREASKELLSNRGMENFEPERICNRLVDDGIDLSTTIDVEPFSLNERLIRQQGLFVMPCSLQLDVETCLFNTIHSPNAVVCRVEYDRAHLQLGTFHQAGKVLKIVLPKAIHTDARRALRNVNIDAASLFPGLDGFARSMHSYF